IILCHGYINPSKYKTTSGYLADMNFYASHGFAVIKPDFRGQGLSSRQGMATSAYYSMDYNVDLLSLVSSLKQTDYINKADLNLWGHSMGAYIALRASVTSKDIKSVVLLSSPGDSLKQLYETYIPPSDENNSAALKVRADVFDKYGTPAKDSDFWRSAELVSSLTGSAVTYQINVGLKDNIVPPVLSADLNSAMNTAGVRHQYFTYPAGQHDLDAQRGQIWSRSLQLFEPDQNI
ncbi:MAG: alpha/beta hydrolase family protein, partial [Candidatus Angelobacter sp.]